MCARRPQFLTTLAAQACHRVIPQHSSWFTLQAVIRREQGRTVCYDHGFRGEQEGVHRGINTKEAGAVWGPPWRLDDPAAEELNFLILCRNY